MDKTMLAALLKKLAMKGMHGMESGAKMGLQGAHMAGSYAGRGAEALGKLMQKNPIKSGLAGGLGVGAMALGGDDEDEEAYEELLEKLKGEL